MKIENKYINGTIKWKDSGEEERVVIKLSCDYEENSKEDEQIFFYCDGEEELRSLMEENNGEDFVLLNYNII